MICYPCYVAQGAKEFIAAAGVGAPPHTEYITYVSHWASGWTGVAVILNIYVGKSVQ